jgi:hypothetical protein
MKSTNWGPFSQNTRDRGRESESGVYDFPLLIKGQGAYKHRNKIYLLKLDFNKLQLQAQTYFYTLKSILPN